jgi:hypothetical protein
VRGDARTVIVRIPARFRAGSCVSVRHGCTIVDVYVDPRLVRHVEGSTGLTTAEAARLVEDVLSFHDEPIEQWVRRRHAELKTYGSRNAEIFARLREELRGHVVAAPDLSERQLRRMIYG